MPGTTMRNTLADIDQSKLIELLEEDFQMGLSIRMSLRGKFLYSFSLDVISSCSQLVKLMLHRAHDGDFSKEDWEHILGEVRYLGWIGDELIANGSICSRTIWLNGIETHVGYIEAIVVEPTFWSKGYGT